MIFPIILSGNCFEDFRGKLFYNNDFDASNVKRIYIIENESINFERGWQGHSIEQRWFIATQGAFKIKLIEIDNWENPSKNLPRLLYFLESSSLDILHIPAGYVICIQALEEKSKLLVMANYQLGETNDEYKYPSDYFTKD